MTLNEHVAQILEETWPHAEIKGAKVETDNGVRLAEQVLEAAILGALDQIEENLID
jgi:hypothetical protein